MLSHWIANYLQVGIIDFSLFGTSKLSILSVRLSFVEPH